MRNSFYKIKNVKPRPDIWGLPGKNIYKIIFLFLLPSAFCSLPCSSQTAPGIEWQNTIGGSDADHLNSVQQTTDGGYILGGLSRSDISGDKTENNWDTLCISFCTPDYWILKMDSAGNIQWQNTIGGDSVDWLYIIRQTADGGYILGGLSNSDSSGDKTENSIGIFGVSDYWMVKTDSTGNIQWQNTIGGNDYDELYCLEQTSDGGYILGGSSRSGISGDKTENSYGLEDYWIVKTDAAGNIQWENTIGGNGVDDLFYIQQTSDGGYISGGTSSSNISGDKTENCMGGPDYWIVKTDASGIIQWQNTIGGSNYDFLYSVQQTTDGGYILGGTSLSDSSADKTEHCIGNFDYWIVKIDASGNIQWQNTIGGNSGDNLLSIQQTSDGGYILGGHSNSNISGDKTENSNGMSDYWIVKTDATGNIKWQNTIGGSLNDWAYSIQQTSDDGYIIGGASESNISGDKTENCIGIEDYWIVKLAPDTITGISPTPAPPQAEEGVAIVPNPLVNKSKLTFKNPNQEKFLFTLYDITGRITESVSTTTNEIILTKGSKQPGIYLFNLVSEKNGERWNGKIVVSN